MFCPYCGVKNEGSAIQCVACKKTIPPLDGARDAQPARSRPARGGATASAEPLGSVGDRMLALVFDRILIAAFILIAGAALADQWETIAARLPPFPMDVVTGIALLAMVTFLYHLIFEAGFGTTLGKAVMGLQVRSESERGRFVAVAIRNVLRIVDGQALYLVGFLIATFSRRRQRLGDMLAATVVHDMPMANGVRAAMLLLWVAAIAAAVWIATAICPTCRW